MISIMLSIMGAIICMGMIVVVTLLLARKRIQKDKIARYKVADPKGIEVLEAIDIEGVKQWLHIRGRNRDNPVLLFLHGGPGLSQIGWFDEIQRPWEEYFTVVQWDQRLAGKSTSQAKKNAHTLTNQQMVADTESVIRYLREILNQEKIFLMGWSYGTYLGMRIAKKHPEWLYAYIGIGQTVAKMEAYREEHALLLDYAETENNTGLVEKLEAMTPYPDPQDKMSSLRKYGPAIAAELSKIGKRTMRYMSSADWFGMVKLGILTSPHYSLIEIFRLSILRLPHSAKYPGFQPGHPFGAEFMAVDLPAEIGSTFEAPIFFISSQHNWHVPYTLADQWFKKIEAPYKEQIWFSGSAQCIHYEEAGKFLEVLVTKILPKAGPTQ